jgi:hypothetical protein
MIKIFILKDIRGKNILENISKDRKNSVSKTANSLKDKQ